MEITIFYFYNDKKIKIGEEWPEDGLQICLSSEYVSNEKVREEMLREYYSQAKQPESKNFAT